MRRPDRLRRSTPSAPAADAPPVEVDATEPLPDWVRSDTATDPDAPDEFRYLRARRRAGRGSPSSTWRARPRLLAADGSEVWEA